MEGIRFAEKNRESTCRFADLVAESVLERARSISGTIGEQVEGSNEQSVVAGFVAVIGESIKVLSVGKGTKFVDQATVLSDNDREVVRDSHAEVLARRGFLKLLVEDVVNLMDPGIGVVLERVERGEKLRLRHDMTLHFYTSTTPCGNSSVRRWATGMQDKRFVDFDTQPFRWPILEHQRIDLNPRSQGQIALSVKRCPTVAEQEKLRDTASTQSNPDMSEINRENQKNSTTTAKKKKKKDQDQKNVFAVGTGDPSKGEGCILSCSDKVALWNACGVQGGILSNWVEPIYLTTMTVGRKFSRRHLSRAVCCRLQELPPVSPFSLHHPTLLCTGVKLSHGVVHQSAQATFENPVTFCWYAKPTEDEQGELVVLNGNTGKLFGSESAKASISGSELFAPLLSMGASSEVLPFATKRAKLKSCSEASTAYTRMKSMALEIMSSRTIPSFARRNKRRRQADKQEETEQQVGKEKTNDC